MIWFDLSALSASVFSLESFVLAMLYKASELFIL